MSADPFVDYYLAESVKPATVQRFRATKDAVMRATRVLGAPVAPWRVADVGCGAGAQCELWARDGHKVFGTDINAALVEAGSKRMAAAGLNVDFKIGSATSLPWEDNSMDVVLCPELLEHVADWQSVANETMRVLKPGGILYLSTTNVLCPSQQEFDLPLYSWYPGFLKRRYERLSVTTRPELVNHAKYPAVHWFSYYQLRRYVQPRGFRCLDRFDVTLLSDRSPLVNNVLRLIWSIPGTRFASQVLTPYTVLFARKQLG